jgi:chemotaxis protein histidine kinase CheA
MNTGAVNYGSTVAAEQTAKTDKAAKTEKTGKITGRTVGRPELSEKAAKYYEQLKSKFGNMEFVLVSKDMKEQAEANAASYANSSKTVVLIDEEKIERMAEDEKYRSQYESLISSAAANLNQIKTGLSQGNGVTSYGIKINDNGTASYFAVIDKSLAAQKERIEKNAEKKAEEKKAAAKKEKEEKADKLKDNKAEDSKKSDTVTVTASSVEELLKKINNVYYEALSDNVMTDDEKKVGQHFDMNV